MLVAIGMKEEKILNDDHFGQSVFYNIYNYNGDDLEFKEKRDNPYFAQHKHAKVDEILEFLGDCKVWVGMAMGQKSKEKLEKIGYYPLIVKEKELEITLGKVRNFLGEIKSNATN